MDNFERSSWLCAGIIIGLIVLSLNYRDYREKIQVLDSMREKNTELIEKVNNLEGWRENLRQITVSYMDLIDEFDCGRITFVEERACMQKYKPQ